MAEPHKRRTHHNDPIPLVSTLLNLSLCLIAIVIALLTTGVAWGYSGRIAGVPMLTAATVTCILTLALRQLARKIEGEVRSLGAIDALTGLPNRTVLMDRLEGDNIAVLYMDLDRFKVINDSLGHDTGDEVLRIAARRIRRVIRQNDLVVRLGGDEFVVVVQDREAEKVARSAARRILAALHTPLRADRRELFVTGSIGIAVKCADLKDPTELMRAADLALYRAKRQGRDQVVVFNQSMSSNVLAQLDLESDLWRAVERGELEVYYQPEISIESGRITSFEALVRWHHPKHGLLLPDSFISLAEENGSLREIGLWVIEESCRQWRRWTELFPDNGPVGLNVNISLRQLEQPDLVDRVQEVLSATQMDPSRLKLEITESVLISDSAHLISQLHRLRQMGVKLAIDDFGTGYSSLKYLKQLPVHSVKIDQSFVRNIEDDDTNLMIVQAIVTLAHDMGLDVTAEGVETRGQLDYLHQLGCDRGQGFYLSEPQPAEAMEALLRVYSRRRHDSDAA